MKERVVLEGQRFGRLKVLERLNEHTKYGYAIWKCICDCGKEVKVSSNNLKEGHTKSCGCLRASGNAKKHNLSTTKIYKKYYQIKKRCYNKNFDKYSCYGGRGIKMCDEWLNDFMKFYNWAMTNGYREDLTIDRIDVNGNYEPSNCRWITQAEQNKNKRNTVLYKGKCLAEWIRELKIKNERKFYIDVKKYGAEQIIKNLVGE